MNLDKLRFADGNIRTSELRLNMQKVWARAVCLDCVADPQSGHLKKMRPGPRVTVKGHLACTRQTCVRSLALHLVPRAPPEMIPEHFWVWPKTKQTNEGDEVKALKTYFSLLESGDSIPGQN